MKKLFAAVLLIVLAALPAASFADAAALIPPYHWTYHALADLAANRLIDEPVEPGKSAFTPEQVVSLTLFAMNRVQTDTQKLREPELQNLRQLVNGYRADFEKAGQKPDKLLADLDGFAAQAGLPPLAANSPESRKLSEAAADSVNRFTFDLYKNLAARKGSLFISPYSVSSALSMTYAGARGKTAAEMEKVLHITPDVHRQMASLVSSLNSVPSSSAVVSTANALWPAKGSKLLPEFVQTVRESYGAGLEALDYKASPAKAAVVINSWVAQHTRGKINNIVSPAALGPGTPLVLTNAVYFKSGWQHEFSANDTYAQPFWTTPSKSVKLPTMHLEGSFKYAKLSGAAMAELPYTDNRFSMLVLLPDRKKDLAELERRLTAENFAKWTSSLASARLDLSLPKFRSEASFDLSKLLSGLGMPSAFGGGADFTGMDGTGGMFIGSVLHKTFVDVAEKGTEAAAATAVIMLTSAAPAPIRPVEFHADRPFIYLIRDNDSGAILFIGRYTGK